MITVKIQAAPLKEMLQKFPRRFVRELATAANQTGAQLKEVGEAAFEANIFEWPALHSVYLAWKEKHGYDSRVLVRSRLMMHALRFRRRGLGGAIFIPGEMSYPADLIRTKSKNPHHEGRVFSKKEQLRIDRRKAARLAASGVHKHRNLAFIMRTHEYGIGVPKRALFEPMIEKYGPRIRTFYLAALSRALKKPAYPASWDEV